MPLAGIPPKFAQLYIYDTENEVLNRKLAMRYGYLYFVYFMLYFNKLLNLM